MNHLDEVDPAGSDDGLPLRTLTRFKDGLLVFVVLFAAENRRVQFDSRNSRSLPNEGQ